MIKIEGFNFSGNWADLGCGSGTFTIALASLLPGNSVIYAMDENKSDLNKIPGSYENVLIEKYQGNSLTDKIPFSTLNGIMMTNSFHYVRDKMSFIKKIENHLNRSGCFLVVEYNTNISNPWVPYPLNYSSLTQLFKDCGYNSIRKLHERPSIYGSTMYSALIERRL